MELEGKFLERVGEWESMSRWERSELGRDLRRLGLSYSEVMELIPAKKSTLATWCGDVRRSDEQIEALIKRRPSTRRGIPRDTQRKRHREIELIRTQSDLEAEHLIDDPLWTAGLAPYWGEGSKTSRRSELTHQRSRHFVSSCGGQGDTTIRTRPSWRRSTFMPTTMR